MLQAKLDAALKAIEELKSRPAAKGPPETPPNRVIPNASPPTSKASTPTPPSGGVPQKSNTEDPIHCIHWLKKFCSMYILIIVIVVFVFLSH